MTAVSKLINRLKTRQGTKRLHRTTRKLQLTSEGGAEHEAAQVGSPRGRVRINNHVAFGVHYLLPRLAEFLQRYPDVQLDVTLSDIVVDLMDDRSDTLGCIGTWRHGLVPSDR